MKINNVGRININPYNKQIEKLEKTERALNKDKIEISTEGMELQKIGSLETARQEKIDVLKNKVSSGEYEVNAKEVAQKMYSFWNDSF